MDKPIPAVFVAASLLIASVSVAQGPIPASEKHQLKAPEVQKQIYSAHADAHKDIRDALAAAARERKRVLLVFGGNWCYDCHVLERAFHEGVTGQLLAGSYKLVHVDIGQGEKNPDIAQKYKIDTQKVPSLAVLAASGKLLYSDPGGDFSTARRMTTEDLNAFLMKWQPK
jgi:thiol:disulfide interchange protein